MKHLLLFSIFILISCGGGSTTPTPDPTPNPTTSSELTLLPGSVNSFQPLDIDD